MVRTLLRSYCNGKNKKLSLVLGVKDSQEGANENIRLKKKCQQLALEQTCNTMVLHTNSLAQLGDHL